MAYTISVADPRRCSRCAFPPQQIVFLNFMHFWENLVNLYVGAPWRVAGGNPGSAPAFPVSVPMNLPKSAWSSPCVHYPPFLCSHSHFTSLSSCLLFMFPVLSRCLPVLFPPCPVPLSTCCLHMFPTLLDVSSLIYCDLLFHE